MKKIISFLLIAIAFQLSYAQDLKVGDKAPTFTIKKYQ